MFDEKIYENSEPVGVLPLTNTMCIEIMDILYDIDDYVVWRVYSSNGYGYDYGKSVIEHNADGKNEDDSSYFVIGSISIPTNCIIATNRN